MYLRDTAQLSHTMWVPFTYLTDKKLRPNEAEQLAQETLARSRTDVFLTQNHIPLLHLTTSDFTSDGLGQQD